MEEKVASSVRVLLEKDFLRSYEYPGRHKDRLFPPGYEHRHLFAAECAECQKDSKHCQRAKDARESDCEGLGCDMTTLVGRERLRGLSDTHHLQNSHSPQLTPLGSTSSRLVSSSPLLLPPPKPHVHFGGFASGDQVIRSSYFRESLTKKYKVIGFEMEGAGVWDNMQTIVIKGVCDYADSHKNKEFQGYAAVTAAACMHVLLQQWPCVDSPLPSSVPDKTENKREGKFIVPFGRNEEFVGRQSDLQRLLKRIPPSMNKDNCQRTAIEGLGGIGKTQIALEAAFCVRDQYPDCSIFWVPAIDTATFENAYRDIGRALGLPDIENEKADIKALVKAALDSESTSEWLLIIDNADDISLLFNNSEGPPLCDYLPRGYQGSILFTTRNHKVISRYDIPYVINIAEMSEIEAAEMLQTGLTGDQLSDVESTKALLAHLAYLPLAIKQAVGYMKEMQISTAQYLDIYSSSDDNMIALLRQDFEDRNRYRENMNPIATTWFISFSHISQQHPLATKYLEFICFLAEKDIPISLLPLGRNKLEQHEAIGALKAYAFITQREVINSFDIHRLVRLAMRNWLQEKRKLCITNVIRRLSEIYPFPEHENQATWIRFMPHAQAALQMRNECTDEEVKWRLLFKIGESYHQTAKYEQSEQTYREALEICTRRRGQQHPNTLSNLNNLALALSKQGKYTKAERIHRQTLDLRGKILGPEHLSTLNSLNNLAFALRKQGKYTEAEEMHRKALDLYKKVLGPDHPNTLNGLNNLALALRNQGKYTEAEKMHRKALDLRGKILGPEHPKTLNSLDNLALTLSCQGKYAEAEELHRRALDLCKKVRGPDHPDTSKTEKNLLNCLKAIREMERQ